MKRVTLAAILMASALLPAIPALAQQRFSQTNLVSDVSGLALRTDANLGNPWGLVPGRSGVFWSANNKTGTSTLYNPDGTLVPLVVTIPGGKPTGIVAPSATDSSFRIPSADTTARAVFIFVTQNGTLAAWSPVVTPTAAIQVATTTGASYTGAALGGTLAQPRLYAANFAAGKIDVYDRNFLLITTSGSFVDPNLPTGFSPFNVSTIEGRLFVSYAQRDPNTGDEVAGAGLGYVSVFDFDGNFVKRFASTGSLNAPWAIVRAPAGFGDFGGSVLVGNFGDGRINAFDFASGSFQATLQDTLGNPLQLEGLWGLHFGLPVSGAGVAQRLYFNAGIEDETHGLFGYLSEFHAGGEPVCDNNSKGIGFWRKQCGGPIHDDRGHGNGNENGKGKGNGNGFGHGNGHGRQIPVPADSLESLLGCISSASSPNAFGTGGCFTADCGLLQKVGKRTAREHATQQLLTARLNLCAGLVCEDLVVTCDTEDGLPAMTLGAVADSMDINLCGGGSDARLRSLTRLLACVNGISGEDGDDDGEHDGDDDGDHHGDDDARINTGGIGVMAVGGNPAHLSAGTILFSVSAVEPSTVQMRIYDAQGRLVAEPMHSTLVNGSARVSWNGRDQEGRLVTPGNYFFRAISGKGSSSGRIVIVR